MPRGRRRTIATGFLVLWLVLWAAGMLVVLYALAAALRRGDLAAAGFMVLWLALAGLGLYTGARKLRQFALPGVEPPRSARDHTWRDAGTLARSEPAAGEGGPRPPAP